MHVPLILIKFDVFSNATLHWVDNHQAFLNGASRSLRVVVLSYFLRWSGRCCRCFASFLNSPPANLGRVILMAFTILLFLWGSGLFTVARKGWFQC